MEGCCAREKKNKPAGPQLEEHGFEKGEQSDVVVVENDRVRKEKKKEKTTSQPGAQRPCRRTWQETRRRADTSLAPNLLTGASAQ